MQIFRDLNSVFAFKMKVLLIHMWVERVGSEPPNRGYDYEAERVGTQRASLRVCVRTYFT